VPNRRPRGVERRRAGLAAWLVLVVIGVLTIAAAPGASAPPMTAPGPSLGPSGPSAPSLTGHWAIAGTSGLDLVQHGTAIRGTSPMGVSLAGTIDGRQVAFRWWKGASFERAKPADRGTGIMQLSADWNSLKIAGKDEEAGRAPFPTQYAAIRVVNIIVDKTPAPSWWANYMSQWPDYGAPFIVSVTRAYLDFAVVGWLFALQTGYWPSPAVAWIEVEKQYQNDGRLLIGGWLPNGGGPAWNPPVPKR
jgi:hypothetical protein